MPRRGDEYHTGRLNISCPPSVKDAIATDATAQGQSISQYILELYKKSGEAGSSEHLARMGLELVGLKKKLVDIDVHMRRSLKRSQGMLDKSVLDDLAQLGKLEQEIDDVLKETITAVKILKERGQ